MERGKSIIFVGEKVLCSTVGHGLKGDVIGHPYFSDLVRNDIENMSADCDGCVIIRKSIRGEDGKISKWIQ